MYFNRIVFSLDSIFFYYYVIYCLCYFFFIANDFVWIFGLKFRKYCYWNYKFCVINIWSEDFKDGILYLFTKFYKVWVERGFGDIISRSRVVCIKHVYKRDCVRVLRNNFNEYRIAAVGYNCFIGNRLEPQLLLDYCHLALRIYCW